MTTYVATEPITHDGVIYPAGTQITVSGPFPEWCALATSIRAGIAVEVGAVRKPSRPPR